MNTKVKDPVCGSIVDTMFTSRRHSLGNAEYFFCSDACMSRFLSEPGRYAGSAKAT
jgi:Cu+-exporting ATPase